MQIEQLKALDHGKEVKFKALVGEAQERAGKGNPYIVVGFNDSTGRVEGRLFNTQLDQFNNQFGASEGDLVMVSGRTNIWNDMMQVVVNHIQVLAKSDQVNTIDYIPSYPKQYVSIAERGLNDLANSIEDPRYQALTKYVMGMDGDQSDYNKFMMSIGSVNYHHNKGGGLAIHTYGVARIANHVCNMYQIRGTTRSRLIFLALVHDIQKREEYESFPVAKRTDLLLSHVPRGASFIEAINMYYGNILPTDELVLCQKALYLHHGEWSNYKVDDLVREEYPMEAKLIHSFDQIEANMHDIYDGDEEGYLRAVLSDYQI